MPAVTVKIDREILSREIFGALRQWSELERNVFTRVHYHGQSLKVVARSLKLSAEEVKAILRQCDRRLYSSLREFRKISCEKSSHIRTVTAALDARGQNSKSGHGIPCKSCKNSGTSRVAI